MKPIQLVEQIKKDKPELLGNLPEKKAAALIRQALILLRKQIEAADEGGVKVPGFGNFSVQQVEREKEGKKITKKRVIFRADKPKSKA